VLWRSRPLGAVGYVLSANLVEEGPSFVALYQPPGAPLKRRIGRRGGPGGRNLLPGSWTGEHLDAAWGGPGTLRLHPVGSTFSVLRKWNEAAACYEGWYVNFERPWRQTPVGFDSRDDVLDLVVADDLSGWRLKDEDELAWSVEVGNLSEPDRSEVLRGAEQVAKIIESREWPFIEAPWTSFAPDPLWPLPEMPAAWATPFDEERS
jgi:hypothetical protein